MALAGDDCGQVAKQRLLYEIGLARSLGVPFYYLGYWIESCREMTYKSSYRPFELLGTDGQWRVGTTRTAGARKEDSAEP